MIELLRENLEIVVAIAALFTAIGSIVISLIVYISNTKQARYENSARLLKEFYSHIKPYDISHWKSHLINSSEPAGYDLNYRDYNGNLYPFGMCFSEGPEDNGALERICDGLEIICYEVLNKRCDLQYIFYYLGQIILVTYDWLESIDDDFAETYYPNYSNLYKRYKKVYSNYPYITITHCE